MPFPVLDFFAASLFSAKPIEGKPCWNARRTAIVGAGVDAFAVNEGSDLLSSKGLCLGASEELKSETQKQLNKSSQLNKNSELNKN